MDKRKKIMIGGGIAAAVILIGALLFFFIGNSAKLSLKENAKLRAELGSELDVSKIDPADYLEASKEEILKEVKLDGSGVDTAKKGNYVLRASYKDQTAEIPVIVEDTTTPEAVLKEDLRFPAGTEVKPEDLFETVTDADVYELKLEIRGEAAELLSVKEGETEILLTITDASGNAAEYTAVVTGYTPDETAPVIHAKDRSFTEGYELDYMKDVTATDDVDGDLTDKITVDTSKVDKDKAGTYTAVYRVSDEAGNEAQKEITVTVKAAKKTKDSKNTQKTADQPKSSAGGSDTGASKNNPPAQGGSDNPPPSGGSSSGNGADNGSSGTNNQPSGGGSTDSDERPDTNWPERPYTKEELEDLFEEEFGGWGPEA